MACLQQSGWHSANIRRKVQAMKSRISQILPSSISAFSKLVVLIVVLAVAAQLSGTAQQGDVLVLNGKRYFIETNPLQPFLKQNPDKLPKSDVVSTSLWRGYVATWEVADERLFLTDVGIEDAVTKPGESGFSTELRSVMSALFPGEKRVQADWFTGHIIVPDGKLVKYVHMGYASTFESYIILRVERGVVTRNWKANTKAFMKFRDAQFAAYKNTDEYRKALAEIARDEEGKSDPWSAKRIEEFLREIDSERYMSIIFEPSSTR